MKIITVTLSPAIDIHCSTSSLLPGHEHLATVTSRDFGGKGINISRVLTANRVPNTALVVLGDKSAEEFSRHLSSEGIDHCDFIVPGRIRENITIHTDDGKETRISFSAPVDSDGIWNQIEEKLFSMITKESMVTLTGRVPEGISLDSIKRMLCELKTRGVKVVIDSKSFSLCDLLDCRPWMIKPNEEEIKTYIGETVKTLEDAMSAATMIYQNDIDNVMVSLGAQGAVFVCAEGSFKAIPPSISPISTIGAGDSAIAGFLAAHTCGATAGECLRCAVAYGTAACLVEGTRAPSPDLIATIYPGIQVQKLI